MYLPPTGEIVGSGTYLIDIERGGIKVAFLQRLRLRWFSPSELTLYLVLVGETTEYGEPAERGLTSTGEASAQIVAEKLRILAAGQPIRLIVNTVAPDHFLEMARHIEACFWGPAKRRPRIIRRLVTLPPSETDYMMLTQLARRGIVAMITSAENLYGNLMPLDPADPLAVRLFEPGLVVTLVIRYKADQPDGWRTVSRAYELRELWRDPGKLRFVAGGHAFSVATGDLSFALTMALNKFLWCNILIVPCARWRKEDLARVRRQPLGARTETQGEALCLTSRS